MKKSLIALLTFLSFIAFSQEFEQEYQKKVLDESTTAIDETETQESIDSLSIDSLAYSPNIVSVKAGFTKIAKEDFGFTIGSTFDLTNILANFGLAYDKWIFRTGLDITYGFSSDKHKKIDTRSSFIQLDLPLTGMYVTNGNELRVGGGLLVAYYQDTLTIIDTSDSTSNSGLRLGLIGDFEQDINEDLFLSARAQISTNSMFVFGVGYKF